MKNKNIGFSGRKHSEETKEKMRKAKLGKKRKPFSKEWIENMVNSRSGYKHSEETKKKISESGKKNYIKNPERSIKLSISQKKAWEKNPNRIINKEGLKIGWELSKKRKEEKNNRVCPICGKNFYRRGNRKIEIMCCSKKCMGIHNRGENHRWWKNGKSREPYPLKWRNSLKKLIRERDNYKCFICKKYAKHVHHIDYVKENLDVNNLITLCASCHSKTNTNRKKWEEYFEKRKKGI